MANEIEIVRLSTPTFTVTVLDNGVAMDLTGYTMTLTVKKNKDDLDSAALLQTTATISTPATGIGIFSLTRTQTTIPPGLWYYEVQINVGTTNVFPPIHSEEGNFRVLKNLTDTAV